jgi:nuclear transport factor 2 (NTF2) superfamily protein
MQVDHVDAVYRHEKELELGKAESVNNMENYMPSCRQCNFYKSTFELEKFRERIAEVMMKNLQKDFNYRLALKYGLIKENIKPVIFYFERMDKEMENCGNCEFHKMMDNGEWGCNNMESDNYGCETEFSDYCIDHEERKSNER